MNWDKLEISILVGGFLVAIAGKTFGISVIVSLGVGLVALDIALVGLEGIITRKMKWGITQHYSETYQGIAAISLGTIMLVAGLGFGAMVIAQALNRTESLFELLFSHPGFILFLVGGLMLLRGLAGMVGALEWDKNSLARLSGFFQRLGGLILFLLGAVCAFLGVLDILAPALFQRMISSGWQIFLRSFGMY